MVGSLHHVLRVFFLLTQSAKRVGSGRNASSSVNVRTAASATNRLDCAAAAPAGWESAVRKVCVRVAELMDLQSGFRFSGINIPVVTSVRSQRVIQACLAPAVGKGASVCTRLPVTTSPESVSVRRGGEENIVTKVQIIIISLFLPTAVSKNTYTSV